MRDDDHERAAPRALEPRQLHLQRRPARGTEDQAGRLERRVQLREARVLALADKAASVGVGGRYYVEAPANGPEWGIRLFVTLMFPEH